MACLAGCVLHRLLWTTFILETTAKSIETLNMCITVQKTSQKIAINVEKLRFLKKKFGKEEKSDSFESGELSGEPL